MTRTRAIVGWILAGLLAAMYLFAGVTKLAAQPMHVQAFTHWGYPLWFMYVVGGWEVLGAILLLIPRTSTFGAVLLGVNMMGAIYTTAIRANEPNTSTVPAVLLVVLVIVGYLRLPLAASAADEPRRRASAH